MSDALRLVTLEIETTLGARYKFPDMGLAVAEQVISSFPSSKSHLTLVNVSQACLVLPTRIISALFLDGVEKWRTWLVQTNFPA